MVYPRFRALLLLVFGAGALLLAAAGVYGVLTQSVAQRIPEFGLRRVVGAQGTDLAGLVLRQGGAGAMIGLFVGVIAAFAGARVMQSLLYGLTPTDPLILAIAALVLVSCAALAKVFPVLHAVRVDPMTALRQE